MHLSPDQIVWWQHGFVKINATIVFTWGLMLVMACGSALVTRKLSSGQDRSRWQNLLEIVVTGIEKQIKEVGLSEPEKYLGFLGTLFLFVGIASLCTIIPGYQSPTASLSTTAALALCVFVAVPFFGIKEQGLGNYLKSYMRPTVIGLSRGSGRSACKRRSILGPHGVIEAVLSADVTHHDDYGQVLILQAVIIAIRQHEIAGKQERIGSGKREAWLHGSLLAEPFWEPRADSALWRPQPYQRDFHDVVHDEASHHRVTKYREGLPPGKWHQAGYSHTRQ